MKTSRDFTAVINWILDNLCPPILRDCYPLMFPIYWIAGGKHTAELLRYKDRYPFLTETEYAKYYDYAAKTRLAERPTDLNKAGLRFILSNASGSCLDAGCGRGYVAKCLASAGHTVSGVDIVPPKGYSQEADGYTFISGSLDALPFPDKHFDTVTCTHVLEHVPDIDAAVSELLRVTKKRLLIVLPRQREYRYTGDLHIRFFPYEYNVRMALPSSARNARVSMVGSDWGILIDKEAT